MQVRNPDYLIWDKSKKEYLKGGMLYSAADNYPGVIWCDFTGRFDAQGKKIYEHDIVCIRNLMDPSDVKYIVVEWDYKRMGWNLGKYRKPMHNFYKIGNVFQHRHKIQGVNL